MLRADARNGTLQRDRAGPERYFLDAAAEGRGYFFAQMNAPFYWRGPCPRACGPALYRTHPPGFSLLATRPLDFPNFLKFFFRGRTLQ
jgi:hypothetical protein